MQMEEKVEVQMERGRLQRMGVMNCSEQMEEGG